MKALTVALALCLVASSRAEALFTGASAGTSSAQFLRLGAGARADGLGHAYTAVVDDADALFWNPAALALVPHVSATFMHGAHVQSTSLETGAVAVSMGPRGALGAGVQYFSAGSLDELDQTGASVGSFHPNDLAVSLGYAYRLADSGFSIGVAGKYLHSTILNSATAGTVDLGVLSPTYYEGRLRFGFAAANLAGKLRYVDTSEPLPTVLRFGTLYKVTPFWLASADVNFPRDGNPGVGVGTEFMVWGEAERLGVALRAGLESQGLSDTPGFGGVDLGVGFMLSKMRIDYGVVPMGDLGFSHRVSLALNF